MSLEIIQTLNPEYTIKSITDEAFRTYGKVIDNNIDEAIEFCIDFVQAAKQDNFYLPSVLEVEQLSSIHIIVLNVNFSMFRKVRSLNVIVLLYITLL